MYGVRKVGPQLLREGVRVARSTVVRLMKASGLDGMRRGCRIKTAMRDDAAPYPQDKVERQFDADRPNAPWRRRFYLLLD